LLKEDRYRLLVLDGDLADGETVSDARSVSSDSEMPIMVLCSSESDRREPEADIVIPSSTPHRTIVDRGLSLVTMSHPVAGLAIRWGPLELDIGRRQAKWEGQPLRLTPLQFRIMEVMMLAAGHVVTQAELSRRLWGDSLFDDNERVQAHIRRIRQKIETDSSRPKFLLTVRGEGYRLADQVVLEPDIDLATLEQDPTL
jgi:two-component system KDP operon response regulator KdpE